MDGYARFEFWLNKQTEHNSPDEIRPQILAHQNTQPVLGVPKKAEGDTIGE